MQRLAETTSPSSAQFQERKSKMRIKTRKRIRSEIRITRKKS
jgi:hypothetical protein